MNFVIITDIRTIFIVCIIVLFDDFHHLGSAALDCHRSFSRLGHDVADGNPNRGDGKARGYACHSFGWSARPRHSQAQELSSPARDEIEEEAVNGLATEGTEVISCGLGGVQTLLILSAEIDGVGVSQGRCKQAR